MAVTYHIGGFDPGSPTGNRAEETDIAFGYTQWDIKGNVIVQRALTPEEVASETPPPATPSSGLSKLIDILVLKGLVTAEEVDPIKTPVEAVEPMKVGFMEISQEAPTPTVLDEKSSKAAPILASSLAGVGLAGLTVVGLTVGMVPAAIAVTAAGLAVGASKLLK
jgi:hypothetical protein